MEEFSFFHTTAKQKRQLKIAMNIFPSLLDKNEDFKADICNTSIYKINNDRHNNLFDISTQNNDTIVKFNGYIIDNRSTYNMTYTFHSDGTSKSELKLYEHWGYSEIKYMPYTITETTAYYDNNGKKLYAHSTKNVSYNKTRLSYINGREERIVIDNDPKKSGTEMSETYCISNIEHLKIVTNVKNKTLYYSIKSGHEHLITPEEFSEKCRGFIQKHEQILVKK